MWILNWKIEARLNFEYSQFWTFVLFIVRNPLQNSLNSPASPLSNSFVDLGTCKTKNKKCQFPLGPRQEDFETEEKRGYVWTVFEMLSIADAKFVWAAYVWNSFEEDGSWASHHDIRTRQLSTNYWNQPKSNNPSVDGTSMISKIVRKYIDCSQRSKTAENASIVLTSNLWELYYKSKRLRVTRITM